MKCPVCRKIHRKDIDCPRCAERAEEEHRSAPGKTDEELLKENSFLKQHNAHLIETADALRSDIEVWAADFCELKKFFDTLLTAAQDLAADRPEDVIDPDPTKQAAHTIRLISEGRLP